MILQSTVYLVEDEFPFRKKIHSLLTEKIQPKLSFFKFNIISVEKFSEFYHSLSADSILNNDIFLLDVDLKTSFTGMDIGKKIRKLNKNCSIIYLTSMTSNIYEIINSGIQPSKYLLKSAKDTSTEIQLLDFFYEFEHEIATSASKDRRIEVRSEQQTLYINYDEVLYLSVITGMRNYCYIHLLNQEIIIEGTLNKLKVQLVDDFFSTSLKSFIIQKKNIQQLDFHNEQVIFKNNKTLDLSYSLLTKLKKEITEGNTVDFISK